MPPSLLAYLIDILKVLKIRESHLDINITTTYKAI